MTDRQRRIFGFWVGVAFGLPFLLISQFINVWALPGIPLFELPIGRFATVVIGTLVFGIMGLIVAWSEESFISLIAGAFFAVLVGSVASAINSASSQRLGFLLIFIYTFLPRVILYLPMAILFRWVINTHDYILTRPAGWLRKVLPAWLVLIAAAVIGARFSLYRPEAQTALKHADAMIQENMSVVDREQLPEPLIPVDGFVQYATGPYTLELSEDVDSLPVTRPRVSIDVIEYLVIARFENGFQFGCAYTPPNIKPKCIHIHLPR